MLALLREHRQRLHGRGSSDGAVDVLGLDYARRQAHLAVAEIFGCIRHRVRCRWADVAAGCDVGTTDRVLSAAIGFDSDDLRHRLAGVGGAVDCAGREIGRHRLAVSGAREQQ